MAVEIITFQANLNQQTTIVIGNGASFDLKKFVDIENYSHVFVLSDNTVLALLPELFKNISGPKSHYYTVDTGEDQKTLLTVQKVWHELHATKCDRSSLLISVGGGVVSDIGGFCAATYMRGISHINVPTTLLAQVDASIGGKNGFNFDDVKNLIGTIAQPHYVIIDPLLLATLPDRQFYAGFAEIIKHGLIYNQEYFTFVTSKTPRSFSDEELEKIISDSCKIKNEIISNDINEKNLRKTVNFGHTVGHAIEIISLSDKQPLLHGEAVSIGMVVEATISQLHGLITKDSVEIIKDALQRAKLPTSYSLKHDESFLRAIHSDKKNWGEDIRCTLLNGVGSVLLDQTVSENEVLLAMHSVHGKVAER